MTPTSQQATPGIDETEKGQEPNLVDRFLISLGLKQDPALRFLEEQRKHFSKLFSAKPSVDLDAIQTYDRIAEISSALATQRDTKAKNRLAMIGLLLSIGTFFVGCENMRTNRLALSAQSRRDRLASQAPSPQGAARRVLIAVDKVKTEGKITLQISLD